MKIKITKIRAAIENGEESGEIVFTTQKINKEFDGTTEEVEKKMSDFKHYLRKNIVFDVEFTQTPEQKYEEDQQQTTPDSQPMA